MKVQTYLTITCCILVIGTAFNYYYNQRIRNPMTLSDESQLRQRFQQRTEQYAERAIAGPITEWQVYSNERKMAPRLSDLIGVEGRDSQGTPAFTVVFEKDTFRALRMVRRPGNDLPLKSVAGKPPREIAAWWLTHIGIETEGKWIWVRDGIKANNRYLSYWRNASCNASISINLQTGHLITLGLDEPNPIAPKPPDPAP
jgi:hypothetical protein